MKIDKGGRPYRVDDRGFRKFHGSPRPDKFTPKEWQRIPHEKRKEIIKAQEMESDVPEQVLEKVAGSLGEVFRTGFAAFFRKIS